MTKEMFDILPPQKNRDQSFLTNSKNKRKWPSIFFFVLLIVILISFTLYTFFYSTLTVSLSLYTEIESFNLEIEVQTSQTNPNLEKKILPGIFLKNEKKQKKQFLATGKDFIEGKARGLIRVYNSHNLPSKLSLLPESRFLSAEGAKIFRSLKEIHLKPAKKKKGKIIPSFTDVEVIAQEGGEEYNIGPSKFSIPGLSGTPSYYTVWGESFSEMKGGFKKEITIISEQDLTNAKTSLKKELEDLIKKSLEEQLPTGFSLIPDGLFSKILQFFCDKQIKEQTKEFYCQMEMKMSTLSFKSSDLKKIISYYLKSQIGTFKNYDPQKLSLEYSSQTLNLDEGKMLLSIKIEVPIYEEYSQEALIFEIKGKSETEIKNFLKNYPQIKKVDLNFSPFWFKIAPSDPKRIKLEIQ